MACVFDILDIGIARAFHTFNAGAVYLAEAMWKFILHLFALMRSLRSILPSLRETYTYIILFLCALCTAQSDAVLALEETIYKLNNQGNYKQSQQVIVDALANPGISASDRVYLHIYWADTYKRLFDYPTTLQKLRAAESIIAGDSSHDTLKRRLQYERALVEFDVQNYDESNAIMNEIRSDAYKYLDVDAKSKLLMQQGYIALLNQDLPTAEEKLLMSLSLMRSSKSCHQPIVLTKLMDLYHALGKSASVDKHYLQALEQARLCGIVKYEMHAIEEYVDILSERKDATALPKLIKKLDSLQRKYDATNNLIDLKIEKSQESPSGKQHNDYNLDRFAWFGMALLALTMVILVVRYRHLNRRNREVTSSLRLMSERLRKSENNQPKPGSVTSAQNDLPHYEKLNDRQREVLHLVLEGKSNKEIASALFISQNTVKYHVRNIYVLLEVENRTKLMAAVKS